MTIQPRTPALTATVAIPGVLDVLFLLVFFLLLGSNWVAVPGMRIHTEDVLFMPGGFSEPVVVAVRADNRILLQGKLLEEGRWAEELQNFFRNQKKQVLVVVAPQALSITTHAVLQKLTELEQLVVFTMAQTVAETLTTPLPPPR